MWYNLSCHASDFYTGRFVFSKPLYSQTHVCGQTALSLSGINPLVACVAAAAIEKGRFALTPEGKNMAAITSQSNTNYIDYATYLQSHEWQEKRERVLIFWKHQCALCSSSQNVNVHHRTYARLGHELLTDLIPLCEECHGRHHDYLRTGEPQPIQAVLERIYEKATAR